MVNTPQSSSELVRELTGILMDNQSLRTAAERYADETLAKAGIVYPRDSTHGEISEDVESLWYSVLTEYQSQILSRVIAELHPTIETGPQPV